MEDVMTDQPIEALAAEMKGKSLGEKLWSAMSDPASIAWISMGERERANFERIALTFAASLSHDETATAIIAAQDEEIEQLRLAICGGEDAPGYAMSLPLQRVLDVADENQSSCLEETELRMDAEAKLVEGKAREMALREALRSCELSLTEAVRDHPDWVFESDRTAIAKARAALTLQGRG